MQMMNDMHIRCTVKKRLPPHHLLLSIKLVKLKKSPKKLDSPRHRNSQGQTFQKKANQKNLFRSSCCV